MIIGSRGRETGERVWGGEKKKNLQNKPQGGNLFDGKSKEDRARWETSQRRKDGSLCRILERKRKKVTGKRVLIVFLHGENRY